MSSRSALHPDAIQEFAERERREDGRVLIWSTRTNAMAFDELHVDPKVAVAEAE